MPDFLHGRKTKLYLNGIDLSRVMNTASVKSGYETSETTTFGQGYQSFVTGLRQGGEVSMDGRVEAAPAATAGGAILRRAVRDAEGRDDSVLSISAGDDTLGTVGVGLRGLLSTKEFTLAAEDVSQFSLGFAGNRGVDDTIYLVGGATINTTTGTGLNFNDDAASAATVQAIGYLHILEFTGGTAPAVTVKIQDSPDSSTWTDLVTFSSANAARTAQRVVVNDVPDKWLRAQWTVTGGPVTSLRMSVSFARGRAGEDVG